MATRMVKKIYVDNVEEESTASSTNSSTGSNCAIIGVEKLYDVSSNRPNQIVGYFFKPSDVNTQNKEIGPYDSTAESVPSPIKNKYTPKMISNELCKYELDQCTFINAYILLGTDDKELELFLGLPPKFRMAWIMKRVPKKNYMDVKKDMSNKKRKEFDVEEEPLKKKRGA